MKRDSATILSVISRLKKHCVIVIVFVFFLNLSGCNRKDHKNNSSDSGLSISSTVSESINNFSFINSGSSIQSENTSDSKSDVATSQVTQSAQKSNPAGAIPLPKGFVGFYYNNLTDVQKRIYDVFAEAIYNFKVRVVITDELTVDDISKARDIYCLDHVEHYYIGLATSTKSVGNNLTRATIEIYYDLNDVNVGRARNTELNAAIDEALKLIKPEYDDYTKEIILHDYLVKNCSYDYNVYPYSDMNYDLKNTAYAALVKKSANCTGYASAMQLLLTNVGIECFGVYGEAGGESHKWNIVKLNGEYYQLDATWDDPNPKDNYYFPVTYAYFNANDEMMAKTHKLSTAYPYPKCTATAENYYVKNNRQIDTNTNFNVFIADIMSEAYLNNQIIVEFHLAPNTPDFVDNIEQQYAIADMMSEKIHKNICLTQRYYNPISRILCLTVGRETAR